MTSAEITGNRFGRLIAMTKLDWSDGVLRWACLCDCGKAVVVRYALLAYGNTKSCGCLRKEMLSAKRKTHGLSRTPEYIVWNGMHDRCYNPNSRQYKDYGGRGILIDESWRTSFANFIRDMGPRPSDKHQLDRIDNDRGYGPGNCRWATAAVGASNKRNNIHVTAFGETKTINGWCQDERCVVPRNILWYRVGPMKWDAERAITEPLQKQAPAKGPVTAFGETKSIAEWTRDPRCKVDYGTLKTRLRRSATTWAPEKAIETPAAEQGEATFATAFGETKAISDWAKDPRCIVSYHALHSRINKYGWDAERAMTATAKKQGPVGLILAFGQSKTISDWARDARCLVTYLVLYRRIVASGWNAEKAISSPVHSH